MLAFATTTGACCWSFALSSNLSSPTPYCSKTTFKTTWMHIRSKHWHFTDYILVHKHDLKDVIHHKVMPSAECHTNYRLVHYKLQLHFRPKPRKGGPPRKSSVGTNFIQLKWKLTFKQAYSPSLQTATAQKTLFPRKLWDQLKNAILQTSEVVLWFTTKKK